MTNIINIRLANGTERSWSVSTPSQEQIDLLPVVIGALDRCNDSLTPVVEESAPVVADDTSDDDLLTRLVESLMESNARVHILYGANDSIAYFGDGEMGVSVCDGIAIPIHPSDNASDLLDSADSWGMSEDVTVEVDGETFTLSVDVRGAIDSYGDIEEVYQTVFDNHTDDYLVDGYTYDERGFTIVEFSRSLTVEEILSA